MTIISSRKAASGESVLDFPLRVDNQLSSTGQAVEDSESNVSDLYISTTGIGSGAAPGAGEKLKILSDASAGAQSPVNVVNPNGDELFVLRDDGRPLFGIDEDGTVTGGMILRNLDSNVELRIQGNNTPGMELVCASIGGSVQRQLRITSSLLRLLGATLQMEGSTTALDQTNATALVRFQTDDVRMTNLPTSSAGLAAGQLWNNAGVVNIV